ncbi:hypothetical protein, partial [Frankia sp. CiP3]|uniref:hypothetical protein n=1 Tax=Frankia sp. CiP3 TaxID=2880971 RepID=UPI001EF4B4B9
MGEASGSGATAAEMSDEGEESSEDTNSSLRVWAFAELRELVGHWNDKPGGESLKGYLIRNGVRVYSSDTDNAKLRPEVSLVMQEQVHRLAKKYKTTVGRFLGGLLGINKATVKSLLKLSDDTEIGRVVNLVRTWDPEGDTSMIGLLKANGVTVPSTQRSLPVHINVAVRERIQELRQRGKAPEGRPFRRYSRAELRNLAGVAKNSLKEWERDWEPLPEYSVQELGAVLTTWYARRRPGTALAYLENAGFDLRMSEHPHAGFLPEVSAVLQREARLLRNRVNPVTRNRYLQEEVGDILGVAKWTIGRWEAGWSGSVSKEDLLIDDEVDVD